MGQTVVKTDLIFLYHVYIINVYLKQCHEDKDVIIFPCGVISLHYKRKPTIFIGQEVLGWQVQHSEGKEWGITMTPLQQWDCFQSLTE